MKFSINQKEFLKGLGLAQGIAERRSTMPMLSNVLLVTEGKDSLQCRATDLYTTMSCRIGSTNAVDGGIAVGAKALFEIVEDTVAKQAKISTDKTATRDRGNHVHLIQQTPLATGCHYGSGREFLQHAIGQRSRRRLVDDTQHLQPGAGAPVPAHRGLSLPWRGRRIGRCGCRP